MFYLHKDVYIALATIIKLKLKWIKHMNLASTWSLLGNHHVESCRFAGSIRPQQPQHLALLHRHTQVPHCHLGLLLGRLTWTWRLGALHKLFPQLGGVGYRDLCE